MRYTKEQAERRLPALLAEYPGSVIAEQYDNVAGEYYFIIKLIDDERRYYGID